MTLDDPMWMEFQPLWSELQLLGNQVHLAGGYGLYLNAHRDEPYRNFHHHEAMKHARDVARIAAMMTRDERDRALEVISEIGGRPYFAEAVAACDQLFIREDGCGRQVAARLWRPDDFRLISDVLASWFR